MKNLKKSLCFCFLMLATVMFASFFGLEKNNTASAAPINPAVFNYISLSTDGQRLETKNFKTVDDTTYIVANNSITISFNSLENNFSVASETNLDLFYETKETIVISKESEEDEFPNNFVANGKTYYYTITDTTHHLNIFNSEVTANRAPVASTQRSAFISYVQAENTITITYISAYTLKADSPNTNFSFSTHTYNNVTATYTLSFMRTVLDFAIDDPVTFTCTGLDAGSTELVDNKLPVEHSYSFVKMQVMTNDYSEENPLYFNINYNGFVYTFELYSKYLVLSLS